MSRIGHKDLFIRLFALLIFLAVRLPGAEAQTDSLHLYLDSTTVVSARNTSTVRQNAAHLMKIDISRMQGLPKILGNTDPLHFVRFLPGVQTSTEYDSGIRVQGCDAAHNEMSVSGVPVFGVNHLLGFFSVFNPEHYTSMTFSHSSSSTRLGGTLRMELPDTLRKPVTGSVSVGMMSSQGTVGIRLGKKSHLRVSARQSYMNLLYKRWLKLNDNPMKYGFGDYNLTYIWHSGDKDKVWVDGYFGMDSAEIFQGSYDMGVSLDWGNYMSSVHWEHKGEELSHRHTLYSSGYRSHCLVTEKDASLTVPAFMNASGYNGGISWRDFKGTAQLVWYRAMPQAPSVKGLFSIDDPAKEIQNAGEGSLSFEYDKTFAYDWALRAGMKGILYLTPESDLSGGLAPDLSLSYDARRFGKLELSYALRQQNIFQTGLSNIGLPVEFWFLAGRHGRPQYSQNLSFLYDLDFCRGMFNLSVGLYHKWLYNQVEYKGDIFDLFLGGYDIDDHLLKGRGWNYGMNLMLHKQSGKVTGWVSYSLGRALRRFDNPDFSGIYPANHERIHELNAVCSYDCGRWDFAGTFVYASGLPFTAPESYYISSGKLIANYGDHNACRMRPYVRLDISVTCSIRKDERQENGINLSIYNVLARRNDVMYRLTLTDDDRFGYRPMSFMLRLVPSISYYHKF